MSALDFKITTINESIVDGIPLKNCILVELLLHDQEPSMIDFFEDSYIVVDQLCSTKNTSGDFYLFSGISGILEEDGWERPANVLHKDGLVAWTIHRGGQVMSLAFDECRYRETIDTLLERIAKANLCIEPSKIFFK